MTTRRFLTAEWRDLAILTFEAEPSLLQLLVPRGTELDTHGGRPLMSLVGFRFLHTRVLGLPIPFHRHFDEVNLRFYVRREVAGELRRGVTFVREIVPRRLIAFVARLAYNEPYIALPMQSEVPADETPRRVRYAWRTSAGWQHLALTLQRPAVVPDGDAEATFITASALARMDGWAARGARGYESPLWRRARCHHRQRASLGTLCRGLAGPGVSAGAAQARNQAITRDVR